jgi:hypothetical protein
MPDGSIRRLTGDEKLSLAAALKRSITSNRFPLSPQVRCSRRFSRDYSDRNRRVATTSRPTIARAQALRRDKFRQVGSIAHPRSVRRRTFRPRREADR